MSNHPLILSSSRSKQYENTKHLYIEADSEKSVREKLKNREYNIELIQLLEGQHLKYEQSSPHFELEQV